MNSSSRIRFKTMKPEIKLKLSIEALDNFGVYPEIIKDMLNDLKQLILEKEDFRKQRDNALIQLQDRKDMGY
jgi:hypothetical protein